MKKAPSHPVNGPLVSIVTAGDGITARELPTLETALDSWGAGNGKNDFDRRIRLVEAWATDVMARAGIQQGTSRNYLDDSVESIATRILREIAVIRNAIAAGDAAAAARGAVDLGIEMGAASVKFQWEKYALKGKKLSPQRGPARLSLKIEEALRKLGWNATHLKIEKYLTDEGVLSYELDTEKLVWRDSSNRKKRLTHKSFETKVSGIKNKQK